LPRCLYCNICHSYVLNTSRHCKLCNRYIFYLSRCVHEFDHHCVWINSCIGIKNYKYFMFMLFSILSNMTIFIIATALLWQEGFWHDYLTEMILIWISFAVLSVFSFLILNLFILHLYLIYAGLTTY
jgi:hypothetical protein